MGSFSASLVGVVVAAAACVWVELGLGVVAFADIIEDDASWVVVLDVSLAGAVVLVVSVLEFASDDAADLDVPSTTVVLVVASLSCPRVGPLVGRLASLVAAAEVSLAEGLSCLN